MVSTVQSRHPCHRLLLAYYDPDGRLGYAGRVGTGIGQAELRRLWRRLQPLATSEMPLEVAPPRTNRFGSPLVLSRVHWVRPELVVEVKYLSRTEGLKALRNTSDARRQAAKLCYRFGPLTPSARSGNLIAGDGTKNGFPGRVEDWRASWPRHPDRATFPAPSTSHAACGFPALRAPICFTSGLMGPIIPGQLSVRRVALDSC